MAAAAHHLHNHLHVHIAQGAGGNLHPAGCGVDDERRVDPLDREQLVGSLRRGDPDIRRLLVRTDNRAVVVNLGGGNHLVFRLVRVDGVGEQALDLYGIGPPAPQVSRGLKGAHTGFQHKILGVEHYPGQKGLRLHAGKGLFADILHQLGHQLRGRAGIRLVIEHDRVADVLYHHAVMVDDDDLRRLPQQLLALHKILRMGVHYNQQALLRDKIERLVGRDEYFFVRQGLLHAFYNGNRHALRAVDNDIRLLVQALVHRTPHADRRADRVKVGILVAHDEHDVAFLDMIAQSRRNDTGAHLIALFDAL